MMKTSLNRVLPMTDTANNVWLETKLPIKNIVLDPLNPRLEGMPPTASEADLVAKIISTTNSERLAKEVIDKQDLPELESLIVMPVDDKYIVLEGNRRMAVYKCLLSPGLASLEKRKTFENLSKRAGFSQNKEVKVIVAPSRSAAAPLLRAKHLQNFTEKWDPRMQVNFDKSLTQSSGTSKPNKDNLKRASLYEIVKGLKLPVDVKEIVDDDKKFPYTTLDRVVFSTAGQEFLGFHVDQSGAIVVDILYEEFEKGLIKIVCDVARKIIEPKNDFGRTVGSIRQKYIPQIAPEFVPDTTKKPASSGNSDVAKKASSSGKASGPKPAAKAESTVTNIPLPVALPPQVPSYNYSEEQALRIVEYICERFHLVARELGNRTNNKPQYVINDEYDVQDLFQSLLRLFFDDVRREEPTPSVGSQWNRFDHLVKQNKIGIEIKKTRKGLDKEAKVFSEILEDTVRYKKYPDCEHLICFVYDPDMKLMKFDSLQNDANELSTDKFSVKLIVNQSPYVKTS